MSSALSKSLLVVIPTLFLVSSFQAWNTFLGGDLEDARILPLSKETMSKAINGITSLTAETFEKLLLARPNENIFFSSFSLAAALSMTAAGARGQTQKEMISSLQLPLEPEELSPAFYHIMKTNGMFQQNNELQLSVANKIWIDQKLPVEGAFVQSTHQHFHAGAETCNFAGAPDRERIKINQWAEAETNGKIKDLIPKGSITPQTAMVLTNAIYFKANWIRSFDPKKTATRKFTLLSNEDVQVPMMNEKAPVRFVQQDTFKAIEKPYKSPEGRELSMVFMLPEESGIKGLEAAIHAIKPVRPGSPPSFLTQMFSSEISVSIPKFKIEFDFEASQLFKDLGMKLAFGGGDFSGISPYPLSITSIIHKAFVEVNEEGTEAAAASAVIMAKSMALKSLSFIANRPFVFFIWDRSSELVLFSGVVADPSPK